MFVHRHLRGLHKQETIMTIQNKGTALITGASTGISAVYADRVAWRGCDLLLVVRNQDKLARLAQHTTDRTGGSVEVLAADMNDKAGLARVETTPKCDASITMLVNNASVGSHKPLLDSEVDAMDVMIALNVTALTRLTYAAAPVM